MREVIGVYPWNDSYLNDRIFNPEIGYNLFPDNKIYKQINVFEQLKNDFLEIGILLTTIDNIENLMNLKHIIFFNSPRSRNRFFKKSTLLELENRMVLFLWEPKIVSPKNFDKSLHDKFNIIFTWDDDLIDNKKYFKFNYPQPSKIINPYQQNFKDKSFCTLIAGNKKSNIKDELYSERVNTINFFEENEIKGFEFYGRGWNRTDRLLERILMFFKQENQIFNSYKGQTNNKLETLSQYKFCICYENQKNVRGYITEKIFDCFFARTVPVYWGAENITDYIPKGCFIDRRDFKNNQEMYDFLVDIDEKKYNEYINSIEHYLNSDSFLQFTDKKFSENIIKVLTNNSMVGNLRAEDI